MNQYNQKRSSLLRIPPELRNRIYALVSETVLLTYTKVVYSSSNLRLVCKQVNSEAAIYVHAPCILDIDRSMSRPEFDFVLRRRVLANNTNYHTICLIWPLASTMSCEVSWVRVGGKGDFWCDKRLGIPALFLELQQVVIRLDVMELDVETGSRIVNAVRTVFGNPSLESTFE